MNATQYRSQRIVPFMRIQGFAAHRDPGQGGAFDDAKVLAALQSMIMKADEEGFDLLEVALARLQYANHLL